MSRVCLINSMNKLLDAVLGNPYHFLRTIDQRKLWDLKAIFTMYLYLYMSWITFCSTLHNISHSFRSQKTWSITRAAILGIFTWPARPINHVNSIKNSTQSRTTGARVIVSVVGDGRRICGALPPARNDFISACYRVQGGDRNFS